MEPEPDSIARRLLKHRDRLFAYIMVLVRKAEVAEELFQDVSLVILRKEKQGIRVERFGPWSREIARRVILHYWKVRRRGAILLPEQAMEALERAFAREDDDPGRDPGPALARLQALKQGLPSHLKTLLEMRYEQGLSLNEIAEQLGKSPGAVQVALSRTRKLLLESARASGGEGAA